MREHLFDDLIIIKVCLRCDKCDSDICCPGTSLGCQGEDWALTQQEETKIKKFRTKQLCGCPETCAVVGPHCLPPSSLF